MSAWCVDDVDGRDGVVVDCSSLFDSKVSRASPRARASSCPPAPALADPATRLPIMRGIEVALDGARDEAKAKASAAGLADAEAMTTATIGKMDAAIKLSYSTAIARVFLVSLCLSVFALRAALLMPVKPRRTGKAGPPNE